MTDQEFFDITVQHLKKQGRKAGVAKGFVVNDEEDFTCLYRAPNGDKCAVGIHILDKQYQPEMEGLKARDIVTTDSLPQLCKVTLTLLQETQTVHDQFKVEVWPRELANLAAKYKLDNAEVLKAWPDANVAGAVL